MKKIVLSSIAALAVATTTLSATQFYVNEAGQVFVNPGKGRTSLDMSKDDSLVPSVNLSKKQKQDIKDEVLAEVKKESGSQFKRITIMDKKSPTFMLGKQTHINMKFVADDNPDMWLKAGVRIQGTFENLEETNNATGVTETSQDAYLRRVRFEIAAGFNKYTSFTMDVRNDKANYQQKGEQTFNVGDAYVKIKKPFGTSLVNFKLYRAKIDISRTETVKSARVIAYDRPKVADEAAQYITHNRRATNAQMYGDWKKKVHYQVAFGDSTYEDKFSDAQGDGKGASIDKQSFFYGGKIVLSPFDGWEEKSRTETYFGVGKHFEIGAAYWKVNRIQGQTDTGVAFDLSHKLINLEASAHYKNLFVQAEYFKFDNVVEDWSAATINTDDSSGYYVTSEYVIPELGYIAPFIRYEDWDKFEGAADAKFTSKMAGVNWYLKGNTIKAGIVYQEDEYGTDIGDKDVKILKVTSQFFF